MCGVSLRISLKISDSSCLGVEKKKVDELISDLPNKYSRRILAQIQTGNTLAHMLNHGSRCAGRKEQSSGGADRPGRCACMRGHWSGARSQGARVWVGEGGISRKALLLCTMAGEAVFPMGPGSRQVMWSIDTGFWSSEVSVL